MKTLKFLLGVIIGAIGLWIALRGMDIKQFAGAMKSANATWLLIPLPVYLFGFIARSWRWQRLLGGINKVKVRNVFPVLMSGFFMNNVLPFRTGEVARAYFAKASLGFPLSISLGSIVAERLLDVLVVFTFAALVLGSGHFSIFGGLSTGSAVLTAIIIAIAGITSLRILLNSRVQNKLNGLLPDWIGRILASFAQGMAKLASWRATCGLFLFSLAVWAAEGSTIAIMSRAFGINLSLLEGYALMVAVCVGVSIPSAPGYVGTYEIFAITALSAMGVDKIKALPFVITLHAIQLLCVSLIGLPSLIWLRRK